MRQPGGGRESGQTTNAALHWVIGVGLIVVLFLAWYKREEFFAALSVITVGFSLIIGFYMLVCYWVLERRPVDPVCVGFACIMGTCAFISVAIMFLGGG